MIGRRHTVLLALSLVGAAACAHIEPPTGGPEDKDPPRVLVTRPDSLRVVAAGSTPVVFVFDERISERGVEDAVVVSPRTSPVQVEKAGDEVRVSLRRGWQPGVIYHVTLRPVLQDLFNNRLREPATLVFSTGPAIPATRVQGTVVDRITAKPDTAVRIEAVRRADSLVYVAVPDSAGTFSLAHIPEGAYLFRAFRDLNRNRALDDFEARDTAGAMVEAAATPSVRLAVLAPDTTPARLTESRVGAEGRVELQFDDYLDPSQTLVPATVQITSPTGEFVAVSQVALSRAAGAGAADSARAPPELPSQTLVVQLAQSARLAPGTTYRVVVRSLRNLAGLSADAQGELAVPAAPATPAPGTAGAARPR